MNFIQLNNNTIQLNHNTNGTDYICGDLHGYYDLLIDTLNAINFNFSHDRLFCTGDLIDRGPQSLETLQLIHEPWFFSTIGNHEIMMFESIINYNFPYNQCWLQNGGKWSLNYNRSQLTTIANSIPSLPYIISVGNNNNRFNICHAELSHSPNYHSYSPIDNSFIDNWLFNDNDINNITWGRNIFNSFHNNNNISFHNNNLSNTFVGHTIVNKPIQIQKHIYVDTGPFLNNPLTIINPLTLQYFQLINNLLVTNNLNDEQQNT